MRPRKLEQAATNKLAQDTTGMTNMGLNRK